MRAILVPAALVVVLAALVQLAIAQRTRKGWHALAAGMHEDLRRGGLQPLLRARMVAIRLGVAGPDDSETAAALAYADARLTQAHALPFGRQAAMALAHGGTSP